jgi:hypothetical protein
VHLVGFIIRILVQRITRKWENCIKMGELGLRIWTRFGFIRGLEFIY